MKPPRTSSLWLAASASAGGVAQSVGRNSCEARAIIVVRADYSPSGISDASAIAKRGRLRHLQTLRPLHPVRDPLVDLVEQLVDEDVGRHLLQHAAVRVDEADVAAAGDAEVGVARLPGPFTAQPSTATSKCLRISCEPLLDLLRERLHADVVATARRAGDHDRPALAQARAP